MFNQSRETILNNGNWTKWIQSSSKIVKLDTLEQSGTKLTLLDKIMKFDKIEENGTKWDKIIKLDKIENGTKGTK